MYLTLNVIVPKSCIYDLWEAFNDIAEGFGLTIEEFQEIIKSALLEYLNVTERSLNMDTEKVFRLFDDDEVYSVSIYLYFLHCILYIFIYLSCVLCVCIQFIE